MDKKIKEIVISGKNHNKISIKCRKTKLKVAIMYEELGRILIDNGK